MLNVGSGAVSPSGSRWLVFMTVLAVYICMIDRIAISIAIIPMAEDNGWSPTVQGAVMSAFFLGYVTLQIPDISKFVGATGWKAKYSFEESVNHLLNYWRERV